MHALNDRDDRSRAAIEASARQTIELCAARTFTDAESVEVQTSKDRATVRAIQVVLYARVSSKDQEKEGFSIPAQLRLLREYAAIKGL